MGETGLLVIEFLPNLRDFPICRMDPKRDTYHVSEGKRIKILEERIKTLRRENNKIREKGLRREIKLKREKGK